VPPSTRWLDIEFTALTRPLYSSAIESMVGARARQGAHHAAQKIPARVLLAFQPLIQSWYRDPTVFAPMNPPEKFTVLGGGAKVK